MALTYPAYKITPAHVVEVFAASGRDCPMWRAEEIATQLLAGGVKPEDYIIAAGDADSSFCMSILSDNIEATKQAIEHAGSGFYLERLTLSLDKMKARLERLEARAQEGKRTGPGTTHAIRNRVEG